MINITDDASDTLGSVDGDGGAFANKAYSYSFAVEPQAVAPTVPLANFIGLANLVYNDTVLNESSFNLNGTGYSVVAKVDDQSEAEGQVFRFARVKNKGPGSNGTYLSFFWVAIQSDSLTEYVARLGQ